MHLQICCTKLCFTQAGNQHIRFCWCLCIGISVNMSKRGACPSHGSLRELLVLQFDVSMLTLAKEPLQGFGMDDRIISH